MSQRKLEAECMHSQQLIDPDRSSHVCLDCGLVLDICFHSNFNKAKNCAVNHKWGEITKDILDRFHIPVVYSDFIVQHFYSSQVKKTTEALLFSIYKVLNEKEIHVSLNDLARAMGSDMSKIYATQKKTNELVELDSCALAEKFCRALKLDSATVAVIKDKLKMNVTTGHTPSTIIAGTIYIVAKERKLKVPIKRIAEVTFTSPISIQRFKNAFSQGRKISKR
jgi:transcription initiation factor TFIIIB Brf1 subunit/transcription initiation factor TFIIB